MEDDIIYAVFATHLDRESPLGYVINSKLEDVEAYFNERKGYGLTFREVWPMQIPRGFAKNKQELLDKKLKLEREIKILEEKIKRL